MTKIHGCPTGNPRTNREYAGCLPPDRLMLPEPGGLRARTDKTHLAGQNVPQLRQLIYLPLAHVISQPCDPGVGGASQHRAGSIASIQHRSKFHDREFTPSSADRKSVV